MLRVRSLAEGEASQRVGPRFSALVAEMSGIQGASRQAVAEFIQNVFGVSISTGGLQKVIDRVSEALLPVHQAIGDSVRRAEVNHVDETSWQQAGALKWVWTMTNCLAAFFIVHSNRSRKAFEALVENWCGILVSDNYGVYRNWVNHRQTCRLRKQPTFPLLADAVKAYFKEQTPNLSWLA
jgi:transposase